MPGVWSAGAGPPCGPGSGTWPESEPQCCRRPGWESGRRRRVRPPGYAVAEGEKATPSGAAARPCLPLAKLRKWRVGGELASGEPSVPSVEDKSRAWLLQSEAVTAATTAAVAQPKGCVVATAWAATVPPALSAIYPLERGSFMVTKP